MNLRPVTLYQITATSMMADLIPLSDTEGMFANDTVKVVRVPVHCIRKCKPIDSDFEDFDETYIAIDPDLQEILEAPFNKRCIELQSQLTKERMLREISENTLANIENRVQIYNDLPWYKRVWLSLRPRR